MNQQQPGCNAYTALGTQACASAMHRVCAQRGANDALATSTNVYETIQQLIGNRPPISLLGVPAAATTTDVSVACAPIQHQSLAVTFEELARRHAGCTDERVAQSFDCSAAVHRWCNGLGWTTGQIFETTTRPWVGCFNAGLIQDVPKDQLGPASNAGNFTSADSKLEVSRWCQARGYGAGVVQELGAGTSPTCTASSPRQRCRGSSVREWSGRRRWRTPPPLGPFRRKSAPGARAVAVRRRASVSPLHELPFPMLGAATCQRAGHAHTAGPSPPRRARGHAGEGHRGADARAG